MLRRFISRPSLILLTSFILLLAWMLPGAHTLVRAYVAPASAETQPIAAPHTDAPPAAPRWQTDDVPATHPPSDLACVSCHESTDATVAFPSGETVAAQVDLAEFDASVHGGNNVTCIGCHPAASHQFPHMEVVSSSLRDYQITQSAACETCHVEPHLTSHPGPESDEPVVCTDCHGSHGTLPVSAFRTGEAISNCVTCHVAAGVEPAEQEALNQVIQSGLFTQQQATNDYCLACHEQPELAMAFPNGDTIHLTINEDDFAASVHGTDNEWQELACTNCHTDYQYPHDPVPATSAREYTLDQTQLCESCHEQPYSESANSIHTIALAEGNQESAVCSDCHSAHDTPSPNTPRANSVNMCTDCHIDISTQYAESVHGETLLQEDNQDVPACIDCHGSHHIEDPTTNAFRANSPNLCADCHADQELMEKYDISTAVFDTYVADFHGTTIMLFDPEHPDAATNEAVCYDCHGVHDIKHPDDPENGIKENLVETCQKCHPDAKPNFSKAWTSHFEPSLTNNTLVFLVQLFYKIVIPVTLIFFAFLVGTDIYRRVRMRSQKEE